MYKIITTVIIATGIMACNNSSSTVTTTKNDSATIKAVPDTTVAANTTTASATTAEKPTVSIQEILTAYLQMKNAFANDNDKNAAAAANQMLTAFTAFNKAPLTADQAKLYNDIEDDAKEHATHIGQNAGNIKHQREHFQMLSKDIYQLAKNFNGTQKLYYDHCPMYNDGKGADWISETKEIKNPYLGKAMPTCGTVKEEIQ